MPFLEEVFHVSIFTFSNIYDPRALQLAVRKMLRGLVYKQTYQIDISRQEN